MHGHRKDGIQLRYWNFVADCPSWTQWRMAEGRHLACYQKSPGHLENLRTIFSMYPQARVIQTHRDPLKTLPSTTSICATARWIRSDRVDIQSMAREFAVGCIRRIYEQLGRPFTESFAADILRYLQNKPKDKFGKHRYRAEDMGVDVAELRARCRNYMQHFGVLSEA